MSGYRQRDTDITPDRLLYLDHWNVLYRLWT